MKTLDFDTITASKVMPVLARTNTLGYGSKIATPWVVQLDGQKPWRRVYAIMWSNGATYYVIVKNQNYYLDSSNLPYVLEQKRIDYSAPVPPKRVRMKFDDNSYSCPVPPKRVRMKF